MFRDGDGIPAAEVYEAMSIAILLFAAVLSDTSTVKASSSPSPVYIEALNGRQVVNCDLIVENPTGAPLDIDEVELSVYDKPGKLIIRRFVDGNGTRPSVRTIDVAEVPAQGKALIFNPFHTFDAMIDLSSMVFDIKLSTKDGSTLYGASVTVKPVNYVPRATMILPLPGRQIVYDGHDFYGHHRRWDYMIPGLRQLGFTTNFMRYSFDFVTVDAEGNMSRGPEEKNESWFGFGREIRAAGAGTVVAVHDAQPDDRKFNPPMIAQRGTMAVWGNYVVVDHGSGELALYGHIRQNSSRVKTGQRVKSGEVIAAVGASGSSLFPHLHFQLQTGPDTSSEGLPSTFHRFDRILGSRKVHVRSGGVDTGEILDGR